MTRNYFKKAIAVFALAASATVGMSAVGSPSASAAAPGCAGQPESYIADMTWFTPWFFIPMRCGLSNNYGLNKAADKHGITNVNIIKSTIYNPGGTHIENGYQYVAEMLWKSGTNTVTVRVVYDLTSNAPAGGPGKLGLTTAYCLGSVLCPSWINSAQPA